MNLLDPNAIGAANEAIAIMHFISGYTDALVNQKFDYQVAYKLAVMKAEQKYKDDPLYKDGWEKIQAYKKRMK